jgi:hypothetical protein
LLIVPPMTGSPGFSPRECSLRLAWIRPPPTCPPGRSHRPRSFPQAVRRRDHPCAPRQPGHPVPWPGVTSRLEATRVDTGNNAAFGLNNEALLNFAYEQLKKTKDTGFWIIERYYGKPPGTTTSTAIPRAPGRGTRWCNAFPRTMTESSLSCRSSVRRGPISTTMPS